MSGVQLTFTPTIMSELNVNQLLKSKYWGKMLQCRQKLEQGMFPFTTGTDPGS